jgi:hypothetical protein
MRSYHQGVVVLSLSLKVSSTKHYGKTYHDLFRMVVYWNAAIALGAVHLQIQIRTPISLILASRKKKKGAPRFP